MKSFALHGVFAVLFCIVSHSSFAQQLSDSTSTRSSDNPFSTVEKEEITMFPNPSDGVVQVSLRETINETITIRVYNRSGEEVYHHHVHFLNGNAELHMKHLQPGIYLLHVETSTGKKYTHYFSKL